ncbi:MAG: fatty acid desaturase, partial [Bacteroidetes bacterium]|nr:fatty acid desaturase [Bacteroidota bacterium]
MATTAKIRFANKDASVFENAGAFIDDVKRDVAEYFESTNRSRHADWRMVLKTVLLFILTFGSYGLILSGLFSVWGMLILAIMMGAGFAGLGFSVAHDALHGAYSANPTINKLLGFTFDFTGANGYMWKITHNVIHHTYTNIDGVDEDLSVSPLLRLSPRSRYYWFHRFQHLYGFFAYGFATMNWLFAKDYQQFMKKEIGPYTNKTHPRKEIAFLIFGKLVVYTYTIIIPLLVLDIPLWQFLIGFLALHITAGMILGIIFQLAHVVEG